MVDEFDSPESIYRAGINWSEASWVNNELQAYTDRDTNIYIENGHLILQALIERYLDTDYRVQNIMQTIHLEELTLIIKYQEPMVVLTSRQNYRKATDPGPQSGCLVRVFLKLVGQHVERLISWSMLVTIMVWYDQFIQTHTII